MKKVGKLLKARHYLGYKIIAFITVVTICIISAISYFKGNVLPVILTLSEATVKGMAVNAINNATHIVIDSEMKYDDFVTIVRDKEDNIELVQANMVKINRLARDLANLSQSNIEKIGQTELFLPLGAFTGSLVLSDLGPEVSIPLLPIGNVLCDFASVFEEVGINQTRHSIYINVNAVVSLVLPISSVPINITTSVLICENIIIGEVPDFYFNNGGGNSIFDLVPNK